MLWKMGTFFSPCLGALDRLGVILNHILIIYFLVNFPLLLLLYILFYLAKKESEKESRHYNAHGK